MIHMKDITTWTNDMLMESIHFQIMQVMRVNGIIINNMDMESLHGQMEMFTMVPLKKAKDMG